MQKEEFKEVLQKNGIEIRTQGQNDFILCPFHPDKNPSMLINNYNTYCFACNRKYSFYEILQEYGIKIEKTADNPEIKKYVQLNQILDKYSQKAHGRLLELINSKKYSYIKNYLLKERKVSSKALEQVQDIGVLTKDTQITEQLKEYRNTYPDKTDVIDKLLSILEAPDEDTLIFTYRNENLNITAFKFRNPRLIKRLQFKLWKKGKKIGLFGLSNIDTRQEQLLAVEGEFNLLVVKSILPDTNIIAVGSSNLDVETLKALLERFNYQLYYCYDNDEPGFKAVLTIKDYLPVYAFTTPYHNDIDEAYRKLEKNDFIQYVSDILNSIKLFNKNTRQWNDEYFNCENFTIEEDTLYYLKEDNKIKITTTPFIIKEIISKYGIELLVLKKADKELIYPKDVLLNSRKIINITKEGFNFTTSECKYMTKYVQQLLDENIYPRKYINPQELKRNGYLKGDVIIEKQGTNITHLITFKDDGIWSIRYTDANFTERKISGFVIKNIDVFKHLLTKKKIYEFQYSNKFEDYKENFTSISDFAKKIVINKKDYSILSLALQIALNKLKTDEIKEKLPDIKYGFYLSEGQIKYSGDWVADTQFLEYLPQAIENLKTYLSLFKDKRKSLAVLYSVINSAFAFIRKQLHIEAMIPILAGKGLTGKTTIVEGLLKMFEVYREKSGQSINSYRRLAEAVNENAIPVLINECENVLKNQNITDILKNIGGQDFVAHSDAKKEITFIAYSGLILTTNKIPNTLDTALISRFVPVIYTSEDLIIDKVKFETNKEYKDKIAHQRQQLKEYSDTFHIIGKCFISYVLENSKEVIEIIKTQARNPDSFIDTGRKILLKFLSKYNIDTSFFEPSYTDYIETITSNEEEETESRFLADIIRHIKQANRQLDIYTKQKYKIDVSIEEEIAKLIEEKDYKTLKEILSIVSPGYLTITTRSTKVIVRKSVIDHLKINLSGGFGEFCKQLGFTYTSRYGERVGVMDFDVFVSLLKQILMIEEEDKDIQKLLNTISFPITIENKTIHSKAQFMTYYEELSEEGKVNVFEKILSGGF